MFTSLILSVKKWTEVKTSAETKEDKPPPLGGACAQLILANRSIFADETIIYFSGERENKTLLNTIYGLNTRTWEWTRPAVRGQPPPPTTNAVSVCFENRWLCVYGGGNFAVGFTNHIGLLDLPTMRWEKQCFTIGTPPLVYGHTMTLIPSTAWTCVVVSGWEHPKGIMNSMYKLQRWRVCAPSRIISDKSSEKNAKLSVVHMEVEQGISDKQ